MDIRGILNGDGLLGFSTYLKLILDEIIENKQRNTVHDLALERLVGYYTTYRNVGDLDFRSGEIFNEIKALSDEKRITLAKHLKALVETGITTPVNVDYTTFLQNIAVKND